MCNFLAPFLQLFIFLHCSVRTKMLLNRKVLTNEKKIERFFGGLKTVFLGLFWFILVLVHRGSLRGSFLQSPCIILNKVILTNIFQVLDVGVKKLLDDKMSETFGPYEGMSSFKGY